MNGHEAAQAVTDAVSALKDEYPRDAHQGRLEQIERLGSSIAGLMAELPDEEVREADYADRLLADHDAGRFNPNESTHRQNYPHEAADRLRYALAERDMQKAEV